MKRKYEKGMPTAFDKRAEYHRSFTDKWNTFKIYDRIALMMPHSGDAPKLLDIGIGTGHELAAIFKRFPNAHVTGLDASRTMLDALARENAQYLDRLELINDSAFLYNLGAQKFDGVLSLATMHHFTIEQRKTLYRSINISLKKGGFYLESDKFVTPSVEILLQMEHRDALGSKDPDVFHLVQHMDIPVAIGHAKKLLREAGFSEVKVADEERERQIALLLATI
jgi:tRNA (cmo5U34)-methyltransferase